MGLRVLMLLSNAFRSDPRVEKEASALILAGYDVTVVAWNRAGDLPTEETRDGIHVVRVGPGARHGEGLANIPAYREFYANAVEVGLSLRPDIVHCHDMDTALPGLTLHRRSATQPRLVLDMHELYRDSNMIPQRGLKGRVARAAVRSVELRAFRAADRILVANPGTAGYYESLGFGGKVTLVENAPDKERFKPFDRPAEEPFTVGFFGQKRYVEGLRQLIEVVRDHPDMRAWLAGGGVAEQEVFDLARDVDSIRVSGPFTYQDLPRMYTSVDAVHAVYDVRLGNVRSLFPVKVMEAMACGLPVVVAKDTWVGEYVERHAIGLAVTAGDRIELEAALVKLAHDPALRRRMGAAGRTLVEDGLSWQAASSRLIDTYRLLPTA